MRNNSDQERARRDEAPAWIVAPRKGAGCDRRDSQDDRDARRTPRPHGPRAVAGGFRGRRRRVRPFAGAGPGDEPVAAPPSVRELSARLPGGDRLGARQRVRRGRRGAADRGPRGPRLTPPGVILAGSRLRPVRSLTPDNEGTAFIPEDDRLARAWSS